MPIPCLARSRGGLSAHQPPLTACSSLSTCGHPAPLFPGFPRSFSDNHASDGDHHYRKLCSEHVIRAFYMTRLQVILRGGCISSEASRICYCGKTDGTTFIGRPIGFSFRPLSKIASLRFFDRSRAAGGVATLYLEFTLYGKNIHSEHAQQIHGGKSSIGTSKSDALALKTDISFLRGPCGRSCPSLWVFNWDARYDVKRVFANCDVEWRVHERCVNPHCERDYNKKDTRLFWPPSSVVPADEIDIGVQEGNISNHQPPYERLHVGVLYAAEARQPMLVHIPLKDGVPLSARSRSGLLG
ncbi:hypothetical protein M405DRAFT_935742 [Rhizopogon salebrosus TDB-379]|nr:hypothetical protein M405DRAFT_935742 [Rhizopogon salebrosus TDB-379]